MSTPHQTSTDRDSTRWWRIVAEREVTTKVREKSFIISTLVMLALVVGSIVLLNVMQGRESTHDVGVVGPEAREVVAAASKTPLAEADNTTLTPKTYDDVAAAKAAVRADKVDAALVVTKDGFELLGDRSVDDAIERSVTAAAASTALQRNAAAQDVDLSELQSGTTTTTTLLDPDAKNADVRKAAAYVLVILFFLVAISFGMPIAQSITQEKESRVVEILAAAVPLRSLLWGKVVGNTLLAIGQVVSLLGVAAIALAATGMGDQLRSIAPALLWYVPFFLLGFGALATLWAVAGALASRQQDLGSTTLPVQMLLMVPYFLYFSGSERVQEIVSMVPVVSMVIMPSRLAEGGVPAWQIGVAVVGTLVAAGLLIQLGARVYERALLRTGNKLGYREALSLPAE